MFFIIYKILFKNNKSIQIEYKNVFKFKIIFFSYIYSSTAHLLVRYWARFTEKIFRHHRYWRFFYKFSTILLLNTAYTYTVPVHVIIYNITCIIKIVQLTFQNHIYTHIHTLYLYQMRQLYVCHIVVVSTSYTHNNNTIVV